MARKLDQKDYVYFVRILGIYTYNIIDSLPFAELERISGVAKLDTRLKNFQKHKKVYPLETFCNSREPLTQNLTQKNFEEPPQYFFTRVCATMLPLLGRLFGHRTLKNTSNSGLISILLLQDTFYIRFSCKCKKRLTYNKNAVEEQFFEL